MKKLFLLFVLQISVIASFAQTKGYILSPTEGVELEKGYGAELKGTPETTGKFLFTVTEKPQGFKTPIHKQPHDIAFYVLDGEVSVFMDSSIHKMSTGFFAFVPANTPYAFSSTGEGTNKWVHLFLPGKGIVEFWQEMYTIGETTPDNEEKNKKIIAAAEKYGIEFIGPSPFK